MKVLFSALSASAVRNFEGVIAMLGERGHTVHLVLHSGQRPEGSSELLESLRRVPGLTLEERNDRADAGLLGFASGIRASSDLLHFHDPRFTPTYRERSIRRAPRIMQRLAGTRLIRSARLRAALAAVLGRVERLLPASRPLRRYVEQIAPDVALFTPYIGLRTAQPDFLRAAQAVGVPTGVCVASWDNLTSKALMRPVPDRVFLWNDIQQQEAEELHDVPAERIVVTGAQCFDQWFDRTPRPRELFFDRLGLDPTRPMVLYACFTPFVRAANEDEVSFVLEWLESLRSSANPALAGANVVIRPHPKRADVWRGVELGTRGSDARTVVWPELGRLPTDVDSKADYFDSLFHSAATVALNSTAMIEAAIVGRPVLTVLVPDFWESQEGTLHFRYLREVGGGLLHVARSLDEHSQQLAEALRSARPDEQARRFVEKFVRPYGIDEPSTPRFVDAVEALAVQKQRLPLSPT